MLKLNATGGVMIAVILPTPEDRPLAISTLWTGMLSVADGGLIWICRDDLPIGQAQFIPPFGR